MTMPRKGTRRITVDGAAYRWRHRSRTRGYSAGAHALTFAVEREDAPGRLLSVTLADRVPMGDPCCPGCAADTADAEPITPSRVAASIRAALAGGWDPRGPAGVHRLDMRPLIAAGA